MRAAARPPSIRKAALTATEFYARICQSPSQSLNGNRYSSQLRLSLRCGITALPWRKTSTRAGSNGLRLTSQDLTDLVIYLQGQSQPRGISERLEISSGDEGESLFRSKGCEGCHTEIPALTERLNGKTLTDIAAAMCNHRLRMAGENNLGVSKRSSD